MSEYQPTCYPQSPFREEIYVRQLSPEDEDMRVDVQAIDLHRNFVAPGYISKEAIQRYIERISTPQSALKQPVDQQETGVFKRSSQGDQLLAYQVWGSSAYTYPQPAMQQLFAIHATGSEKDTLPAYIQNRYIAEPGRGYGTILRHAAALQMEYDGFTVVGNKVCEFEWTGHADEIDALDPVLLRRSEEDVQFAVEALDPFAVQRTEVYVGIAALKDYLQYQKPWLSYRELV